MIPEGLTLFKFVYNYSVPSSLWRIEDSTILIENLSGKIRKYPKNKTSFPTDDAVKNLFMWL
jgi:transposase-like protein